MFSIRIASTPFIYSPGMFKAAMNDIRHVKSYKDKQWALEILAAMGLCPEVRDLIVKEKFVEKIDPENNDNLILEIEGDAEELAAKQRDWMDSQQDRYSDESYS